MAAPGLADNTVLEPALSWSRGDPEKRLGFRGGRFTQVNTWLALLSAIAGTIGFYAILSFFPDAWLTHSFTRRGPTPYFIALFSAWSLSILFYKWRKLVFQRRTLAMEVV